MKTLISILAAVGLASAAWADSKISELPELAAPPASSDWLVLWDTSAATSKKISPGRAFAELQPLSAVLSSLSLLSDPDATALLYWNDAAGAYQNLLLGNGLSVTGGTLESASSGVSLPTNRVAYGSSTSQVTSEAAFTYDPTLNVLAVGAATINGVVGFSANGSGVFSLSNIVTSEDLLINLGSGGADTAFLTSSSGVSLIDAGSINIKVPTEVYDAANWDADLTVPTKDAVRDKIEALSIGAGGSLTASYIGYGSGADTLTGEAAFAYNATTNTATIENVSSTTVVASDTVTADAFKLIDAEGVGSQKLSINTASDITADRILSFNPPDADTIITFPATITVAGINYANSWSDGVKQTFNPNATNSGMNVGQQAGAPSSLTNGDLWYDSTANELTARIAGQTLNISPPIPQAFGGTGTYTGNRVYYGTMAADATLTFSPALTVGEHVDFDLTVTGGPRTLTFPSAVRKGYNGSPTTTLALPTGDHWVSFFSDGTTLKLMDSVPADVPLGTETSGNYVATIADSGASEVTVTGSGSETAGVTLALASTITRDAEWDTSAEVAAKVTDSVGTGSLMFTRTGVRRIIYVNAGAMIPRTTNGAAATTTETTTNKVMYDALAFDQTTEEYAGFWVSFPKAYNSSTVTVRFHWMYTTGSGTVKWDIAARSYAQDDQIDQAMGTEQTASADTGEATGTVHLSGTTPALTFGGTAGSNIPVYFQIARDVAGDTLSADALLLGVTIEYTESATEPSAQ